MDDDELKQCHEEVHRLETENKRLRQSAEAFGQLAERLNGELIAERRQRTGDRRLTARGSPDRRAR
jgi:hypothetical protein